MTASSKTPRERGASQPRQRPPLAVHPAALGINNEAERALLASTLFYFEALEAVTDYLTPEDFFEPKYQTLSESIGDCPRAKDGTIDVVLLSEHLKSTGKLRDVGHGWLHELYDTAEKPELWREYLRIVLECSLARSAQKIGAQLTQAQFDPIEATVRLTALQTRRERVLSGGASARQIGVLASDVQPEPIRWLWRRRLARGKLAIIDGDPGLGKGLVTIDLAARKSAGRAFPGDFGITQEPGHVLLITPEDDIADTIVPRLMAAKADLSRVHILNSITEVDSTTGKMTERAVTIPRDVPVIEQAVALYRAELLIIDPILGCLDVGVKTAIDSEVRTALMPLKYMATRTDLTVVLVRHFNKSSNDKAMYRGGASIAFTALCRTAFILAEHPDNGGKRVILPVKSNIAKQADGLTFSLAALDDDAVPWVSWDSEPCDLNANDVIGNGAKRSAFQREILEAMKNGSVTLPAKPIDIAAAVGIGKDDESGQARVRQALPRMMRSGAVNSPAYGLYDLPHTKPSHLSH